MTTYEAYQIYLALKLHFTTENYDIKRMKGRVRTSLKSLEKKPKIQFQLQKFIKRYSQEEYINFLVANFIKDDKWGGMYNDDAHNIYLAWLKTHESLTYCYTQDLAQFSLQVEKITDLWECDTSHPLIIRNYFGKTCTLETLVILNKLYKFSDMVDEKLFLDPVWTTISSTIHKYSPFIKIDKEKFTMLTEKVFA